ncbi:hypothetical protein [uncultured Jatrophihabitans sp.]|uniref:hypothetical protein n=1 Tax=uncultured Jatrophihabitans sp. TaxID=1610747 RepID=UPI0035CA3A2C
MTFTRGTAALSAASLGLSTLVAAIGLGAAPAGAASTCSSGDDLGHRKYTVTGKQFQWDVAQRTREENYSGHNAKLKFEVSKSTTRSNSVKVSASVKGSADFLWASFEAEVGASVGHRTDTTTFAKSTRYYTLGSGDSYIFGQGTGWWRATGHIYQCAWVNAHHDGVHWYEAGHGPIVGYTGLTRAVVGCKKHPAKTSFSAVLKKGC